MAAFFAASLSVFCILFGVGYADLSPYFYTYSCPGALIEIQKVVNETVAQDPRMGASLLRLHFHDCFVNGCDASVLLDDTLTFIGEKSSPPNANSLRGFEVIDSIKSKVDSFCGRPVVSCADILAVAARDSVVALGGPTWTVQLGRQDSLTASFVTAKSDLPSPTSSLDNLKNAFANKGLSVTDMVALSGGHTIGMGQCNNYRTRIYTESNINSDYATSLRNNCPLVLGNTNLSPLDGTAEIFDNTYYKDLVNLKGLFHSDQELYNNGFTNSLVRKYSTDAEAFYADFKIAMINMGNLSPPAGSAGEVRTNCRRTNNVFF